MWQMLCEADSGEHQQLMFTYELVAGHHSSQL